MWLGARRACLLGGEESSRNKRRKTTPALKKPPQKKPQQLLLDFGQRSLGARRECTSCGLLYVVGDVADEATHARQCTSRVGVAFGGWQKETVVARFELGGDGSEVRVLEVRSNSVTTKPHREKLEQILALVNSELGGDTPFVFDDSDSESRVYIAVRERRIVGCCVVEAIDEAFELLESEDDDVRCSEEPCSLAALGVQQLWVLAGWRRQKIATRLLDAARSTFFFETLARSRLAFSHPTRDGLGFARAYLSSASLRPPQKKQRPPLIYRPQARVATTQTRPH